MGEIGEENYPSLLYPILAKRFQSNNWKVFFSWVYTHLISLYKGKKRFTLHTQCKVHLCKGQPGLGLKRNNWTTAPMRRVRWRAGACVPPPSLHRVISHSAASAPTSGRARPPRLLLLTGLSGVTVLWSMQVLVDIMKRNCFRFYKEKKNFQDWRKCGRWAPISSLHIWWRDN